MVTVQHSLHHACVLSVLWLEEQPPCDHGESSPTRVMVCVYVCVVYVHAYVLVHDYTCLHV